MFASLAKVTIDRARNTQALRMTDGFVSQWLSVGEYRSCFCIGSQAVPSAWLIEGRLPNRENVKLASYASELFVPGSPRYVTMKAMCGLPIRFVAAKPQTNSRLWVVFKS